MISQTAEYAFRAMVCLAQHPERPQTRQQIAEATRVPGDYLAKVMRALASAGLVRAERGPTGGFSLAADPSGLNLLAVLNAVDPIRRITHCPLGLEAHGKQLCPLHRRLDDALAHVEQVFRETTLEELLRPGRPLPLCNVAIAAAGARP